MAFVSDGTQYEVSNHTAVYHEGDDVNDFIENTVSRIVKEFDGETAYRIVDIKNRRNNAQRTLVQHPSLEPLKESTLVTVLEKHLLNVVKTDLKPIILEIRLFVSSNEPIL